MGKVGEKLEELESYLWVVLEREEVVRGGGSTAGGGRRRYCAAVAAFRRGVEVMAGLGASLGREQTDLGVGGGRRWLERRLGVEGWPWPWRAWRALAGRRRR